MGGITAILIMFFIAAGVLVLASIDTNKDSSIKKAAKETKVLIDSTTLPEVNPSMGKDHLHHMCDQIINGKITGGSAHRWLGWVQGCIVVGEGATLDQIKALNKSCKI